ncbi:MAG TPA: hypothetical protein PK954_26360 [Anaerolineales bacterium]|nr:hypothetical protein [Anaerolineales bacterium]
MSVWSNAQHQHALRDPDIRHLTLEPSTGGDRLGYVILAGLAAQTGVIEFRRLVVTAKGQGYGHGSVRRVQDLAFESLGAHRPGWM